jgi:O-antigen/teichoic acid export membrane protein
MSLIALLELFSAFGLDSVLIQERAATDAHFNTAWTMNVLAACVVGLLLVALAVPASVFYHEPRLVPVICIFALASAVQGFENIGVVLFRKDLQFDREFRYLLAKKLMGFLVTVPLAFWLRDFWALVYGMLVSRFAIVAWSYAVHPFRPRFALGHAAQMMHFSKWLVLQNALTFLRERAASFVIGRFAGPAALGTFTISAEIASMPGTELVAPINRGILPAYSRLAGDPPALGREYLSVMSGIALLAVPAVAGVALAAPFIVLAVLGPKWAPAIPLLEILAFAGITHVLQSNSYAAFIALGKPGTFAKIQMFHVGVLLAMLAVLVPPYGAYGAAWAYLVAALVALPVNFHFIVRSLGLTLGSLLPPLWRPLASAALMYGAGKLWGPAVPAATASSSEAIWPLLACVALGATVYVAVDLLLWLASGRPNGAETWLLRVAKAAMLSVRARLSSARSA